MIWVMICFGIILICFVIMEIRNYLVYKARIKEIGIIYKSGGDYDDFNRISYNSMLFSLTKWTHSQFYK